jgi:hypothetical protein
MNGKFLLESLRAVSASRCGHVRQDRGAARERAELLAAQHDDVRGRQKVDVTGRLRAGSQRLSFTGSKTAALVSAASRWWRRPAAWPGKARQNNPLQLSGAMSKGSITVRLLEVQLHGALSARL